MNCMERFGKCFCQSCSVSEACSNVFLPSQTAKKCCSKYDTFISKTASGSWVVPNCMLLQSVVASEILIFSGVLRSLSPGNSDLAETLVWLMSSRTKSSDSWISNMLYYDNYPERKWIHFFNLVEVFFVRWAEYQRYCWNCRGEAWTRYTWPIRVWDFPPNTAEPTDLLHNTFQG